MMKINIGKSANLAERKEMKVHIVLQRHGQLEKTHVTKTTVILKHVHVDIQK